MSLFMIFDCPKPFLMSNSNRKMIFTTVQNVKRRRNLELPLVISPIFAQKFRSQFQQHTNDGNLSKRMLLKKNFDVNIEFCKLKIPADLQKLLVCRLTDVQGI